MTEAERLAKALETLLPQIASKLKLEAAALIRSQAAEIERKSDAIQRLWKERDDLRAERDALRADAERYRWLRDKSVPPHQFYISVPEEFADERFTPSQVDAAIDAARQS